MSSLLYSSRLNNLPTTVVNSSDQRICDQGNKYIIQLRTDDFRENEFVIKVNYPSNQLIIDAQHIEEDQNGGYIRRELHKVFSIPKHIDLNKYTHTYNRIAQELTVELPCLPMSTNDIHRNDRPTISSTTKPLTFSYGDFYPKFDTSNLSILTPQYDKYNLTTKTTTTTNTKNDIDMTSTAPKRTPTLITFAPIQESAVETSEPFDFDSFHQSAFRPQIIQTTLDEHNRGRKLIMTLDLRDYLPEDIKVSVKGHELIVKAKRRIDTNQRRSRATFFQSTSLPPQTVIEHLQSNYVDGDLVIEAPYRDELVPF